MRHATRLALVLVLLGMTALFQAENARSESIDSSCEVIRNCDYGPPIECTSPGGSCSSGPENYGWVECDGNREYCPPPCTYVSGNGICECPEDPDCIVCSYPDCDALNGTACVTPGKRATCSVAGPSGCFNTWCNCDGSQWVCP